MWDEGGEKSSERVKIYRSVLQAFLNLKQGPTKSGREYSSEIWKYCCRKMVLFSRAVNIKGFLYSLFKMIGQFFHWDFVRKIQKIIKNSNLNWFLPKTSNVLQQDFLGYHRFNDSFQESKVCLNYYWIGLGYSKNYPHAFENFPKIDMFQCYFASNCERFASLWKAQPSNPV